MRPPGHSGDPDAVVIGAGPNGLACANRLADAGWDVLVLEAGPSAGGAVASADYLGTGAVADVCSAFYPLAAASPVIAGLGLEHYGLRWRHAPVVLAHPLPDGRAALLYRDPAGTAASVEALGAGDGEAWLRLTDQWNRVGGDVVAGLLGPFPPLRAGARLASRVGLAQGLRLARRAALPVRRLAEEEFAGPGAPLLLAGSALHTDLAPEATTSALFGWLLTMLGQQVGFPVPEGGAARLATAMVARLAARGGRLRCDTPVRQVLVEGGRAAAVVTAGGDTIRARRAVMAAVPATTLFGQMVSWTDLPEGLREDVERFQWDHPTIKVDWRLRGPVPWLAPGVADAGTVHVADDLDEMTRYCADLATGRIPTRPFLVVGQMNVADPSRTTDGSHVVWAYTHLPRDPHRPSRPGGPGRGPQAWDTDTMVARMEARLEEHAPGFGRLITARQVLGPEDLERHDAALVGGAITGGTSLPHQQLFFRPWPGLGRPETVIRDLYLASSSAHPGGGVHGACGSNAARAALVSAGPLGRSLVGPALRAAGRRARGY